MINTNITNDRNWKLLDKECRLWAIKLVFCSTIPPQCRSPFDDAIGCSVNKRKIYVTKHSPLNTSLIACKALHELAHIVHGARPIDTDNEVNNGMLAIEYWTAKLRKFEDWEQSMTYYCIDDTDGFTINWENATKKDKNKSIEEATHTAKIAGWLDKYNRPTYGR